ncbi:transglutaminase N-terminal domain-containing protein [Roseomonas sp. CCTCC AB2023176]|uniref:transglutaminase family protein n=1 Tax=Roseomonas sp. CCTCC AB2023176 TaxID=3342640 RepID=UPI0035DAA4CC
MSRAVSITHVTTYRYDRPVFLGQQTLRLTPAPHAPARILSHALTVAPANHVLREGRDPQGGVESRVLFEGRVDHFEITARLEAELRPVNPFDFVLEGGAERWPFDYDPLLRAELAPCLAVEGPGPGLAAKLPDGPAGTVPMLIALARRIATEVRYIRRDEQGVWPVEETLTRGEGSCRDTGWVLVHAMRALGIAARFCSGYLLDPDEGTAELHAWAEAFLPGAGWVGFDPTSGLLAAENHLPLSAAADPRRAAPVTGTHEACGVAFSASIRLETPPG